jgi:hypothetical protein
MASVTLRFVGATLLLGLLSACGGDEPVDDTDTEVKANDADGVSVVKPKDDGQPPKVATITGRSTDRVEVKYFSKDVLDLKSGDIVSVKMRRGSMRGTVSAVRPKMLTVMAAGSGILSRLTPGEVMGVKLLFREDPNATSVSGDIPLNEDEQWLDRFADRDILGKPALELWTGRYEKNVALVAKKSFKLDGLIYVKRRGTRVYFVPDDLLLEVKPRDQIKIVGLAKGYQKRADGSIKGLGEVFLLLVRRGRRVRAFQTKQRLRVADFTKGSVSRYMQREPVTLVVQHEGSAKYLKIDRVKARVVATYKKHLKATPTREQIRKMRARTNEGLRKAEQQVRSMYEAVGLKEESDLDKAIVITFRVPSDVGGQFELVPYTCEIGLD